MRTVPPARGPAGTCRRARRRLTRPLPGTRARCLGRARRLLAAPARGLGSCGSLPGSRPWVGEGGPAHPFSPFLTTLAFPPTTLGPAFVLLLSCGVGPPPRRSCPGVQPARTLAFRPGLFHFYSSLDRLPFLLPSGSRGKVASSSLPKTSSSLRGAGWELGVCANAIDSRSSSGLAPALPRGGWALQPAPVGSPELRGESLRVGGMADRGHHDFPQDPRGLLLGRSWGSPTSILSVAPS